MTFERLKNILIPLLVFLAIFQTSAIWFSDIDGNFLSIFSRGNDQGAALDFKRNFTFPMRVVTGDGSHNFRIVYGGMNPDIATVPLADELLFGVLSRDDIPSTNTPDFGEILRGNLIIYEYAFEMPADKFVQALGLRPGVFGTTIERFNQIIFSPHESAQGSGVHIHFHNTNTGAWAGYFVRGDALNAQFRSATRTNLRPPHRNIYFASSYLLGAHENPYNNLFIPIWGDGGHRYFLGEVSPAHFDVTDGAVMNVIRGNVISFFSNPAVVYDVPTSGAFAWADENTIVRHFRNNVLQYISYRRDLRGSEFLDDFSRALDFMDRQDLFMTDKFYLSRFYEQGNERVFHFEYIFEGLPVIFADDLRNSIAEHTTSGITVRFRDGNLMSYTRLAYAFTLSDSTDIAGLDLPQYLINSGLDLESLENVTLAFVAPRIDSIGTNTMSLWANFRLAGGISAMESLSMDTH